jgi:hypothetical protein
VDDYYNQSVVGSWFSSVSGANSGAFNTMSAGLEYNYNNILMLRAGYHVDKNIVSGNNDYVTVGSSIKLNNMQFNLGYIPPTSYGSSRNPLSNTLSFGLNVSFK